MISALCQRQEARRVRYRPAGETIDPSRYGMELLDEAPAKSFVIANHYSGSYPAACVRVGLYRRASSRADLLTVAPALVGVAVFSVPPQPRAIRCWTGTDAGLELGRLVLLHDVPGNGESWFLGRAFRLLQQARPGLRAVLAYSDPVARRAADGSVITPGHVGIIYQAHNGRHVGRSGARTLLLDPDGRIVSRRGLDKIRGEERGAAHAYAQLLAQGAPPRRFGEDGHAYVDRVRVEGPWTRLKHPGNLAYVWPIGAGRAATEAAFPPALPYVRKADGIIGDAAVPTHPGLPFPTHHPGPTP